MQAVEKTIQNLIGSGMDPKTENNPYYGFIYTSFQERATKVKCQPHASKHCAVLFVLLEPAIVPVKLAGDRLLWKS